MLTAFISDLHLSPNYCENSKIFTKFLLEHTDTIEKLYILGDFTNYWVGDDIHINEYSTIIKSIHDFNSPTPRTFLMHGNRDFLYGTEFFNKTKIQLIDDPFYTTINNKKALLTHGDLLFDRTIKYQVYRRTFLFLSKFDLIKNAFFKLSTKFRINLANNLRATNTDYQHFVIDIQDNNKFVKKMRKLKIDILIHGHTHIPSIQLIKSNEHYITRYTLSDWHGFGNMLEVRPNEPVKMVYF